MRTKCKKTSHRYQNDTQLKPRELENIQLLETAAKRKNSVPASKSQSQMSYIEF